MSSNSSSPVPDDIERISCSSVPALRELIASCKAKSRSIVLGKPHKLPPNPVTRPSHFVTLEGINQIIEHFPSDQVISVETGITLSALQTLLHKTAQWFPVYTFDPNLTVMEFINQGDAGPLEHAFGEARDLVLGMTCILGSGESIKCGGKVVKNVTGYDLVKMFCGAQGTLCIPVSAHLRLYARPDFSYSVIIYCKTLEDAFKQTAKIAKSGLPFSCVELVDPTLIAELAAQNSLLQSTAQTGNAAAICVQIHGMPEVVADLRKDLSELLPSSALLDLDASAEHSFWQELSRFGQTQDGSWVRFAASKKTLQKIIEASTSLNTKSIWTARPSRHKALFRLPIDENAERFVSEISKLLPGANNEITAAYPSDSHSYQLRQLPDNDLVLMELKRRIKAEYDPRGILNPLAAL